MTSANNQMNVSHSRLNTFLRCPKQYWFEYLDPYTSRWEVKKSLKKPRPELEVGNFVHIVLNKFFSVPKDQRSFSTLKKLLEETWKPKRGEEKGFKSEEEERDWYKNALLMLANFYKYQTDPEHLFYVPDPEGREEFIKVPIGENLLIGKVDRIDKTDDGLHIIDYKTGKSQDDEFQVMIYVLLVKSSFRLPITKASYFYLRTGKFKSVVPSEQKETAVKKRISSIISAIEKEKDFTPKQSKLCGWCDFIEFCPAKTEASKIIGQESQSKVELPF